MSKILLVAIIGNIGATIIGQFFGWASPALPKLSNGSDGFPRLSLVEGSWVVSLLLVGSTVGSIACVFTENFIGRKTTMIATTVPSIIGCLLIVYATSPWELYVARFTCGLSVGATYVTLPIYLGEISPANIRGILISYYSVSMKLGAVFAFLTGLFLSVRNFSLVQIAMPIVYAFTLIWLPESPYYLMRRGNRQKAVKALAQLRGKEDVGKEADIIEQAVKIESANGIGFKEILLVPSNRRALVTEIVLISLQQLSGGQVIIQYAETIFDQAPVNLQGKYLSIVLGCVQTVFLIVCMILADYCGRRMLLMISTFGTTCSTAMIGTYFYLRHIHVDTTHLEWLPSTGMILYMIMYSIGFGSIPYTMLGELFSMNVKTLSNIIVMTICNGSCFIVTKWYLIVADSFGMHVVFWFFSACSFAAIVFSYAYVPETKGKSLERIQEELKTRQNQADS